MPLFSCFSTPLSNAGLHSDIIATLPSVLCSMVASVLFEVYSRGKASPTISRISDSSLGALDSVNLMDYGYRLSAIDAFGVIGLVNDLA